MNYNGHIKQISYVLCKQTWKKGCGKLGQLLVLEEKLSFTMCCPYEADTLIRLWQAILAVSVELFLNIYDFVFIIGLT